MSRSYTCGVSIDCIDLRGILSRLRWTFGLRATLKNDLNGYGYIHARLGWTGFGLRANIVEKYVLFRAVLHVAVALE